MKKPHVYVCGQGNSLRIFGEQFLLENAVCYFYRVLQICSDTFNLPNEFNILKSLAVSRGYNPSVIDKALNKFKKPKRTACSMSQSY